MKVKKMKNTRRFFFLKKEKNNEVNKMEDSQGRETKIEKKEKDVFFKTNGK